MRLSIIATFAFLALTAPLADTKLPCFLELASVADDPAARDRLIVSTYASLFEKLGGKVAPETVKAMAEQETPFKLPGRDPEIEALQKWLREFEAMLERNGWNTPAVRSRLNQELRSRSGAVREVETKRESAIARQWRKYDIEDTGNKEVKFSPDGRYGAAAETGLNGRFVLIDMEKRTVARSLKPRNDLYGPVFSEDGSKVIFTVRGMSQVEFPFANGQIDWAHEKVLFPSDGTDYVTSFSRPLEVPGVRYVSHGGHTIKWGDTNTGRITVHKVPAFIGKNPNTYSMVPGLPYFYFLTQSYQVVLAKYDARGNFTETKRFQYSPKLLGTVLPTRDRKHLVVSSWQERGKPGTFPIEGGAWEPFLTKSGGDDFQGFLYDGLLHPTKNEFYLFTYAGWPKKSRVYVIDLATRRETRSFELPSYVHDPFLTPDGNFLYGTDDRNNTVQVHNLRMYD